MWRRAATAAATLLVGLAATFLGSKR
jgi:hypothetical protein